MIISILRGKKAYFYLRKTWESMPEILQAIMQFAPSTHFVIFAQAILYRGQALPWYGRIMPRSALSAWFSSLPPWRGYAKASP